jgi:beta-galactosidase
LLLRGTQRHEDHAGVAAALTDDVVRREMRMIKDVGANFIRLGHYQQSRLVLDLCDELGLLVWEEIPWCRGGLGGARYRAQARDMLAAMIDQHFNHPCVLLWGLGNENDWPGDFQEFDEPQIRAFMGELNDLAHRLDPGRQTAIRRCDFCKDIVDVYSPSIWAGWYRGRYTEYKASSEQEMKKVRHFFHAEWGGDSHAGRHAEDPDRILSRIVTGQGTDERGRDYLLTGGQERASLDGDWSETYICNLFDWHLKEQDTMPWLTGAAQWIFKDFSTPLRPENPIPRVNQKGLVTRDLTPKESYYVFQSYWSAAPMIHIYGHTWPIRWGEVGETKLVKVYSNCPRVELFVNGASAGVRARNSQDFPAAGLRWMVRFREGENVLRAVAQAADGPIVDEIHVRYQTGTWGPPARLQLREASREGEVVLVEAAIVDGNGALCLDARHVVRFGLAGDGRLVDNLGTPDGSRVIELANGRARIRLLRQGGPSTVSVSAKGVPTTFLTVS